MTKITLYYICQNWLLFARTSYEVDQTLLITKVWLVSDLYSLLTNNTTHQTYLFWFDICPNHLVISLHICPLEFPSSCYFLFSSFHTPYTCQTRLAEPDMQ